MRTISTSVTSDPFLEGYRTNRTAIEWDGNDDFGSPVGKGTYIYKVLVKSQNQEKCKGTASLVEKLVILNNWKNSKPLNMNITKKIALGIGLGIGALNYAQDFIKHKACTYWCTFS